MKTIRRGSCCTEPPWPATVLRRNSVVLGDIEADLRSGANAAANELFLLSSSAQRAIGDGQGTCVWSVVRFAYNEDSNVIITVTGSASQLRGSEFLYNRQLFPEYRPMGLSKYPACSKILNGPKQIMQSENSMGS